MPFKQGILPLLPKWRKGKWTGGYARVTATTYVRILLS